jgi:hypothetical protein
MTYHVTKRECWRGELSLGRFLGTTLVLVLDAGFEIRQRHEAKATRYVVRAAKNVTGRRAVRAGGAS